VESAEAPEDLTELLGEQVAYYRALASEYGETAVPKLPIDELVRGRDAMLAALRAFRPTGDVLELACGPGTWTPLLLESATRVTAVDAAGEMLELAARRTRDNRVQFVEADLLSWEPDRRYDDVFFGFWLSHVPMERFEAFWSLVERCLKPGGRVAFTDDGYRAVDELIEGDESSVIRRRLLDGTPFRAVKVPHTPECLEQRLGQLGWRIGVRSVGGPFFWGSGTRD
jgi:SAM-dependent methyltransferase